MAEHREKLRELAIERAEYERAAYPERVDWGTGIVRWSIPAAQRDTPAYPSKNKKAPKYAKDRFGVTDIYSKNRKDKRRGLRTN